MHEQGAVTLYYRWKWSGISSFLRADDFDKKKPMILKKSNNTVLRLGVTLNPISQHSTKAFATCRHYWIWYDPCRPFFQRAELCWVFLTIHRCPAWNYIAARDWSKKWDLPINPAKYNCLITALPLFSALTLRIEHDTRFPWKAIFWNRSSSHYTGLYPAYVMLAWSPNLVAHRKH